MNFRADKHVFGMTRPITLGWGESFSLNGTPDVDMTATQLRLVVPSGGFLRILMLVTSRDTEVEFCCRDDPHVCVARLPNKEGVDPWDWMQFGGQSCKISPLRIGPSYSTLGVSNVRMRIDYSGLVPKGLRAGDRLDVRVMLIGVPDG